MDTIGQHHTRGNSRKLTVMRCGFDLRKYCFTNRIVNMWNSLPDTQAELLYSKCDLTRCLYIKTNAVGPMSRKFLLISHTVSFIDSLRDMLTKIDFFIKNYTPRSLTYASRCSSTIQLFCTMTYLFFSICLP